MSELEIKMGAVLAPEFYAAGGGGWSDELLTRTLGVPGDVVSSIFPPPEEALSLTGFDDSKPIGQRNYNTWKRFLEELPQNLGKYEHSESEGVRKFVEILRRVWSEELELQKFLELRGYTLDKIAHACGIMILNQYRGRGYAMQLQRAVLPVLLERGYSVAVVETTNIVSASIMDKVGFIKHHAFSYKSDFDVNLDDFYTLWYKVL